MKLPDLKLTREQRLAKARLYKHLEDNQVTISIDDISVEMMGLSAKTNKLANWLTDVEFAKWWYERDSLKTNVAAYAEIAIERLYEVLTTPIEKGRDAPVSSKDVLAAAKTMLELADAFPKKNEVVFADKALNKMTEDQVDRELESLKGKLVSNGKT